MIILYKSIKKKLSLLFLIANFVYTQNYFSADPYFTLVNEKKQFDGKYAINSNLFKPFFYDINDNKKFSVNYKTEFYLNDNVPNQENMDVRYFAKGYGFFSSLQFSLNSKYAYLIFEPYLRNNKDVNVDPIYRYDTFNYLNDFIVQKNNVINDKSLRNFLVFLNLKKIGIGYHKGNRWWGPGIHTTLQMTNNTWPIGSIIAGNLKEIKIGKIGLMGLYSFSKIKDLRNPIQKYHTALNGQITYYGSTILSIGFSRNYLSGGDKSINGRTWTDRDAQLIIFEGFLTKNLVGNEYTIAGHDQWDQTISGYLSLIIPDKKIKLYAEIGFNDNRMYLADLISQPDHTIATIFGFRNYGASKDSYVYGFEWTNLMISYTAKHRGLGGTPAWYSRQLYNYSTFNNRRWGAHSGSDSDDWFIYFGYISDKLFVVPSLNYERHGIVTNRPAEVKVELKIDLRYNYKNTWFGLAFEKQNEFFLGFPDYFYEDKFGKPIDSSSGNLASSRIINTLILSVNKIINL